MKNKGYTLMELVIVVAIVMVFKLNWWSSAQQVL